MASPLKIAARVEIDAAPAKQGAAAASSAVDTIGAAAERNTTKVQALINATVGLNAGAANQNAREWVGALSMQGRSVDELRAKYNPLFATISQYKAAVTEIRTLHAQNVLSTNEMTAAIQRHRQAALASIDVIKGRGAAIRAEAASSAGQAGRGTRGFETANIAAQFQDIAVTSAMGMSPIQIALQQGTQLSAVISSMERPAAGLAAAFGSIISPVSLVTIGIVGASAAALQWLSSTRSEVKTLDDALAAHQDSLGILEQSYGRLAASVQASGGLGGLTFSEATLRSNEALVRAVARQQNDAMMAALTGNDGWQTYFTGEGVGFGELRDLGGLHEPFQASVNILIEAAREGRNGLEEFQEAVERTFNRLLATSDNPAILRSTADAILLIGESALEVDPKFRPFENAINRLKVQIAEGNPNLAQFQAEVERIGKSSGLQKIADEAILLGKEALTASRALLELERARRAVEAGQRGYLIGSPDEDARNAYLDQQRLSLRQMQLNADARRAQLFARSPEELAAAARQAEAARSIAGESAEENRLRIELAGTTALVEAEKELADARRDRGRALDETIGQQQLELSLIGKTVAEQERLRMEFRLTSELKAEAARTGTEVDQAELARVKQLSAEYGRLAEQMTARRALDEQNQEIAALRVRLALVGQSEQVRARILLQLQTERELREMGLTLGSREAEQYRRNAELRAAETEELRKQEAAWSKVRGTAEGTIDSILDGLLEGDLKGAFATIFKDWSRTIMQLGVANPLKNMALGTNYETLADIGGLEGVIAKLFGGGMTTPAMSVTATSVMINGGLGAGGAGGLFGLDGGAFKANTTLGDILGVGAAANDNANLSGSGAGLAWNFWKSKGLADHQVAGILGNIKAESAFNPFAVGDGGNAFGLYQHNDRRFNLFNAIGGRANLGDELAQHRFAYSELMGPENRAWQSLLSSRDVRGATAAFAGFERPSGFSWDNPEAAHNFVGRLNGANEALAKFGGGVSSAERGLGSLGDGLKDMSSGLNKFGGELSKVSLGNGGGGGLGGFNWGSLFSSSWAPNTTLSSFLYNGFEKGGATGGSNPARIAGVVHEKEFVFDAAATERIGVPTLEAIRRNALGGWREGGAVTMGGSGRKTIPSVQPLLSRAVGGREGGARPGLDIRISYDKSWDMKAQVREIADQAAEEKASAHVQAGLESYNSMLPERIREINANPRKR